MPSTAVALTAAATPASVFARLRDEPGAAWLDGGDTGWSILVWSPREVHTAAAAWPEVGRGWLRPRPGDADLPFVSGVVGYVGWEAGHAVEAVPAGRPTWEPPVHLGRYEGALLHHGATGAWVATGPEVVRREAAALLADADGVHDVDAGPPSQVVAPSRAAWLDAVARVHGWLDAGDCYQVNLAHVVRVRHPRAPWPAWLRLRASTCPARGAYLVLDGGVRIASASPERLLDVEGAEVVTEPIKGTRPRGADAAADARLAAELEASEKERAELTMIVDLVRNDLGRVARPGSVVAGPRTIRPTPYCHHAFQEVRATLAPGRTAWDALAALFPPGSVCGAPKVRAATRIRELEPEPRGVAYGAIGHVSDHGRAAWSVAIRTAVWRGDEARYHVGGGLVVDSEATAEWDETEVKGRRLRDALVR